MEFEIEVKVVEEPIISEIIIPEEKPDELIKFDEEMSKELGYKYLRYSTKTFNNRFILTTVDDEEIVVPNDLVEDKLRYFLDKVISYDVENSKENISKIEKL